MIKRIVVISLAVLLSTSAFAGEVKGLVVKKSPHSVGVTLDRLEKVLKKKGITIVARWRHSQKAAAVGIPMRDTELLIFGNPKLGSHLMTSQQTVAIDLPMKTIAWKDEGGQVWIGYNDPAYLSQRHGIKNRPEILKKMAGALNKLTNAAVGK